MSTFAKATYNVIAYSLTRPTYSIKLFDYIFSFHRQGSQLHPAKWDRAVDLGCGTGQATVYLQPFREVVGIDPSMCMLQHARVYLNEQEASSTVRPSYTFLQAAAEDLRTALPDNSVDLLIAAQSCHWFDWSKVWPETRRVLQHGGSAAFWVYTEFRLTQFPTLSSLITSYTQGSDPRTSIGPHFQRPGRTILERFLVDVPEPSTILKDNALSDITRVCFYGKRLDGGIPSFLPQDTLKLPTLLRQKMSWRDLLGYLRTQSALHTFHEKFPDDLNAKEDTRFLEEDMADVTEFPDDLRGGDISIRFWKDLRQGVLRVVPNAKVGVNDKVEVEWPLALLLVRKV